MSAKEFDTAYAKLDRAREHQATLAEVWSDYIDGDPFDFQLVQDAEDRWILRIEQDEPLPTRMSVIFGEWLFNLRSALDSIIWATAVHVSRCDPPPNENRLQYPIYSNEKGWKSNEYRLEQLAPHHREMLLQMQPFKTKDPDANFLGWINRLAQIDRHRRMTIATARIAVIEPVIEASRDAQIQLEWGEFQFHQGTCEPLRFTIEDGNGSSPRVNPRAGIDPEIAEWGESAFWKKMPFADRLQMLEACVRAEAALYEYDCTGETRDRNPTTASFQEESESRRASQEMRPIVRPPRPAIEWSAAAKGSRSTRDKLLGLDFPNHGPGATDAVNRLRSSTEEC